MSRKSLILTIMLVFMIFISICAVSAVDNANSDSINDTPTTSEITVNTTDTNDQIQEKINSLNDGDILNFEKGDYKNISLYVNKSITINGNGATLYGYDTLSNATINPIIQNKTTEGGYAITNLATLYILKTDGLILKDINFIAGANSGTDKGADSRYSNCVIYNYFSNRTTITNITVNGCSWGIWLQNCADTIVENNKVTNQGITGIFSFQSPRSIIRNNTVKNAKNHGIDVRHQAGPNAKVINNTVIGSKEGIYLLHSKGHTVTGNEIINCSLSSVTCCGASNINIYNNKFKNSRIGILLGGGAPVGGTYTGYNNITIGSNEWKFDKLPMPPSFEFYVAEAKGDYASASAMMGTYTDSEKSNITYVEYAGIETPEPIAVDYDTLLKLTGNNVTITAGMNNTEIQNAINGMSDGDTLIFEKNAVFEDICIYTNKNIKIMGNNATLKGLSTADTSIILASNIPDSYTAKQYAAVLYTLNNTGVVISNLNIISNYPNYSNANNNEYKTACIFAENSRNLTITGCKINGASWGLFVGFQKNGCPNSIITNNIVTNQYTTGIICFGSKESIIANNTVTNAKNHGIDVRFLAGGQDVTVFNNTVFGAKEGIYLLHSYGHKVYQNTILNSKISSVTCYGSYNEYIFNNTFKGSRIAILLGGNYYQNVTIGPNSYTPDKLPFPPTFENYVVVGEYRYQSSEGVIGVYSDSQAVKLTANDVTVGYKKGTFEITLKDSKGKAIANKPVTVTIADTKYDITTDANGVASINLTLTTGNYTATVHTVSDYYNKAGNAEATIIVNDDRTVPALTASAKTVYLKTIASGYKYSVTLKDASGKSLVNKSITVTYNGKTYTATTNKNDVATVTLKATATGSKSATVKFDGDDEYKAISKSATIKVTKEASKITAAKKTFNVKTKTKQYTITLKSKSGKAIAKAKVTIKVNGKTYKATTNSKGKATFKITKLTKKGTFKATVKFTGDKYYSGKTANVKITTK
ncbi:NosD domain-containing protein [uncultured Methanobrevibacter sp.]|uniref:NosD domain-containing protein n=1 Tax=uncultured Methanobrevibacter sp. TaxID=253161 RepID=UPI002631AA71|nr:NosD domain-containing protein [uncultured Methanobrevibacter sp.]